MPKYHLVLTESEFNELMAMKMLPLDDLPLDVEVKTSLRELAAKKIQTGHLPEYDPIPRVVCGMVGDSVVCRIVPRD